jgi:hypothetical protein
MRAHMHRRLARFGLWAVAVLWLGALCLISVAHAADAIPREALRYQHTLVQQSHFAWGLDAPISSFAAQVHTESRWQPGATSPVGAQGITQFMPSTETWINRAYPELARLGNATNPVWGLRALVTYDRYLWDRIEALNACEHMAMVLSSYNGGLGWLQRDRAKTTAALRDRWFGGVETANAGRANAAWNENRAYPRLILRQREPLYIAAGWGPGVCND